MRVASIGLVYHKDMDEACRYAALQSEVTHPHPTNGEACQLYTRLIVLSLRGASKATLVEEIRTFPWKQSGLRERFSKYTSTEIWRNQAEQMISSSGWVVDTLEASLWALFTTDSFREGAVKVVNLGDDADTRSDYRHRPSTASSGAAPSLTLSASGYETWTASSVSSRADASSISLSLLRVWTRICVAAVDCSRQLSRW